MNVNKSGRHDCLVRAASSSNVIALNRCAANEVATKLPAAEAVRPPGIPRSTVELIRQATLAASSHNTQPWVFRTPGPEIVIEPDLTRRTPVVDPDDHHLYASLGCAAENLSLAACGAGHSGEVMWESADAGSLRIDLTAAPRIESPQLLALPERQVSRTIYDKSTIALDVLARIVKAGSFHGVDVQLLTDERDMEDILTLIVEGNARQISDPAFVAELKHWIRFNARSAEATGDGLFSGSSGNPSLPNWIAPSLFHLVFTEKRENDKVARQIRSSSGIAVFIAASDDPKGWVDVGRAYERFALQTTLEGVQHAFVNQAVEVVLMRRGLQTLLGIGERRPSLLVRYGRGASLPRSRRRPVEVVLASQPIGIIG